MKTCCRSLNTPRGGDEGQWADFSSSTLFAVSSVISDVIVRDSGDSRGEKTVFTCFYSILFQKQQTNKQRSQARHVETWHQTSTVVIQVVAILHQKQSMLVTTRICAALSCN